MLDTFSKVSSVLDMRYLPECKQRNHLDRHADKIACDIYEEEDRARMREDITADIAEMRQTLALLRDDIKQAEAEMARQVREAFQYGASATKLARAAGLSRERIYQIRDGRR